MKTNRQRIKTYLNELFPEPKCELNYNNDYELLIAIALSAQTTDKRVNEVSKVLFSKYNNLYALSNAPVNDIEDIIRSIGSYSRKSRYVKEIAKILYERYDSKVPVDRDVLIKFPGVGRKTANVFLSEYYNYPAIAVDTHVDRVSKRLGIALEEDNVRVIENKLMEYFDKQDWARIHLQLVLFGRYKCKALRPLCRDCKLKDICIEKE